MKKNSGGGFTLVELLVVLAVLAVLIAILTPVATKGITMAQEATCRSNLRQIGLGAINYANETGYLPPSYEGGYAVWPAVVREFSGGSTDLFFCPLVKHPNAPWKMEFGSGLPAKWGYRADEVRLRTGGRGSLAFSYGHNNGGTRDSSVPQLGMGDPWNKARLSSMQAPQNFIMFADSLVDGVWDHFIDEDVPGEEPARRHRGGAYIVCGDNHVEHIIPDSYLDLGNTGANDPEHRRRWNLDDLPH